ncbi:hypothetical protein V7S43_013695 [Phytophthora oleae]|uniref:Uncharacterized protein n=1 Tax=Phytophthora oleae TaxID=2107226 RepID=A0ABD3F3K0_9STRA
MPGDNWEKPAVLLAVGNIQASLDDVMLGLTTQTFGDMRVRAASIASHDVSGATLAKLSGPTEQDSFQNLSVMWMVGEQGWPLSMFVRPRDFVLLGASGVITCPNGDRIGCDLVQPAQLPQLPVLPKPMTRGKLMYGAMYKEQQDGTVDVYIQLYVETMGHILDAIVMNAMWIAVLGFWEAPRLVEEKKLQWWILNSMENPRQKRTGMWTDRSSCGVCKVKLRRNSRAPDGLPSANHTRAVCGTLLCTNCRIKRSFKVLTGRRKGPPTRSVHVVVCPACLILVREQSAAEVAWQQHQQRTLQANDSADSSRTTWGLLDDAMTPSWSPGRFSPSRKLRSAIRIVERAEARIVHKPRVDALQLDQLLVRALFRDLAAAHHTNLVRLADRRQSMSNDDRRTPLQRHHLVQSFLHHLLALRVQGTRGFVQQQDVRVLQDGTSDGDTLLLTTRQLLTLHTDLGIVAVREFGDESVRVGHLGSFLDLFLTGFGSETVGDVLSDSTDEQCGLLTDKTDLTPKPVEVEVTCINAIEQHLTFDGVVKPLNKGYTSTFTAAARSTECNSLSSFDSEVVVAEDSHLRSCWVPEEDVLELNLALKLVDSSTSFLE